MPKKEIKHTENDELGNIVLYQPFEAEQILLPENASCLAVKTYLKMCNLKFEIKQRPNAEHMSPGGRTTKLPVVCVGAFVIPELEQTISFFEGKGVSLSKHLDADQNLDLRAYMALTEVIFPIAEIYLCWLDKQVLEEHTLPRNGVVYPWPLNFIQNFRKKRHFKNLLSVHGWAEFSIEEVIDKVKKCCENLTDLLGDKKYFYGNKPTELDALVYAHLFTIFTTELANNCLAKTVSQFSSLREFTTRIEREFFKQ